MVLESERQSREESRWVGQMVLESERQSREESRWVGQMVLESESQSSEKLCEMEVPAVVWYEHQVL